MRRLVIAVPLSALFACTGTVGTHPMSGAGHDSGVPSDGGDGTGAPVDAGPSPACGDGICDGPGGETCVSCALDCDTREPVCGNGECQPGETPVNCYADCGPAEWPLEWASWEAQVVVLLNEHRAAGTNCPGSEKGPVAPLAVSAALTEAARLHSWDMSYSGYFTHDSCNGREFPERAAAHGSSAFAETLSSAFSPEGAVDSWMTSPGHCNIVMSGGYVEVGMGYSDVGGSRFTGKYR